MSCDVALKTGGRFEGAMVSGLCVVYSVRAPQYISLIRKANAKIKCSLCKEGFEPPGILSARDFTY